MIKNITRLSAEELRRQAEATLALNPREATQSEADVRRLLHDLQVHQIELEMQNEILRETTIAKDELEQMVSVRTADLLVARDAAEAANRAKSAFLVNMSHELRTPMNAIMGMTDLAMRGTDDPKMIDRLTKVMKASRHLLALINDILDLSKIDAGKLHLEQTTFRLGSVLEDLSSMVNGGFKEKGLALNFEIAPDLANRSLRGDPMRLMQILLNLVGNAMKFTAQGSVTVRMRLHEDNPDDVLLHCEVQDTGIGISAEDRQRLFADFIQADASMTRKYGGTGLGLALSKRLTRIMGGDIGVESALGQGSTFWFTVRQGMAPAAGPPAPSFARESAEAQLKARHGGTRILLAEDEPVNQEVSRDLLEGVGLKVDLAADGVQAVALARQNSYALILMDMQMPNLNGIDATREIRALPGYAEIPILAMTANAFDDAHQGCIDAGMNDHIGKPTYPDVLFETLLRWLSLPRA